MTVGMQLRAWLREADRSQVVFTVAALIGVGAVLSLAVVPVDHRRGGGLGAGLNPSSTAAGAADGPAAATPGTAPAASDEGAPAVPVVRVGGGALPGGAQGPVAASAGGDGRATAGGATRTASDIGVTSDVLKIGVSLINVGPFAQAGQAVGLRADGEQAVAAYVADINSRGGVAGRKLVAVTRRTDILTESDQQAACTFFAKDEKVFAVLDVVTFDYESTVRCLTYDNKLPLVHTYALTEKLQNGAGGLDVTSPRNSTRIAREWATAALDQRFLRGGEAVGILANDCDPNIDEELIPIIRRARPSKIVVRRSTCNQLPSQTNVTADVLAMYNEGVTHIFPAAGGSELQLFTRQAQVQRPPARDRFRYFVSEYLGVTTASSQDLYDPDEFDGARGVVGVTNGHSEAGKPDLPAIARCSAILVAHGLPPTSYDNANGEVRALCDHFLIFESAMRHAGESPTRAGFASGVQQVGRVEISSDPVATLGPRKFSAADAVADLQWYRSCTCFKQTSDYRPGKF